jgi:hypothetical protein
MSDNPAVYQRWYRVAFTENVLYRLRSISQDI